jgi:hypothetical protein
MVVMTYEARASMEDAHCRQSTKLLVLAPRVSKSEFAMTRFPFGEGALWFQENNTVKSFLLKNFTIFVPIY